MIAVRRAELVQTNVMLEAIFSRYRDYSLLVLRLFVGIVFFTRGTLKFIGGLQGFAKYLAQHDVPLPELMAPIDL